MYFTVSCLRLLVALKMEPLKPTPIPHSKLDPPPASISSLLEDFPLLLVKPTKSKYCILNHTKGIPFRLKNII